MRPRLNLLRKAYAIIDGIPDRRIDLNVISRNNVDGREADNPRHCGTIACALGWLGMHPKFQALGLRTKASGSTTLNGSHTTYIDAASEVFKIESWDAQALFGTKGQSRYDPHIPATIDKELVLARIRTFLDEAKRWA